MPLFFFDIDDDGTLVPDADGIALEHRMDVPREAVAIITELMMDGSIDHDTRSITCRVRDEAGRVIYGGSLDLRGSWGRADRSPATGSGIARSPDRP